MWIYSRADRLLNRVSVTRTSSRQKHPICSHSRSGDSENKSEKCDRLQYKQTGVRFSLWRFKEKRSKIAEIWGLSSTPMTRSCRRHPHENNFRLANFVHFSLTQCRKDLNFGGIRSSTRTPHTHTHKHTQAHTYTHVPVLSGHLSPKPVKRQQNLTSVSNRFIHLSRCII